MQEPEAKVNRANRQNILVVYNGSFMKNKGHKKLVHTNFTILLTLMPMPGVVQQLFLYIHTGMPIILPIFTIIHHIPDITYFKVIQRSIESSDLPALWKGKFS